MYAYGFFYLNLSPLCHLFLLHSSLPDLLHVWLRTRAWGSPLIRLHGDTEMRAGVCTMGFWEMKSLNPCISTQCCMSERWVLARHAYLEMTWEHVSCVSLQYTVKEKKRLQPFSELETVTVFMYECFYLNVPPWLYVCVCSWEWAPRLYCRTVIFSVVHINVSPCVPNCFPISLLSQCVSICTSISTSKSHNSFTWESIVFLCLASSYDAQSPCPHPSSHHHNS